MFAVDTAGTATYVPTHTVLTRQFTAREIVVASGGVATIRPVNTYRTVAVLV